MQRNVWTRFHNRELTPKQRLCRILNFCLVERYRNNELCSPPEISVVDRKGVVLYFLNLAPRPLVLEAWNIAIFPLTGEPLFASKFLCFSGTATYSIYRAFSKEWSAEYTHLLFFIVVYMIKISEDGLICGIWITVICPCKKCLSACNVRVLTFALSCDQCVIARPPRRTVRLTTQVHVKPKIYNASP